MFINSVTKTLFGPKNLDGTWPTAVSMVGPKGDQGLRGGSGPAAATGVTGVAEPVVTGANCIGTKCTYKIGDTGPGGGLIFFVDYFNQYEFNYLEAAPNLCESTIAWSSSPVSVTAVSGWAARAVGRGQSNTTAIMAVFTGDTSDNNAAYYATSCSASNKSDWFLGSLGEMRLMYDNLQGVGGFVANNYWSSSENNANNAWNQNYNNGNQNNNKNNTNYVRPEVDKPLAYLPIPLEYVCGE
jgi:hypothetical protein